MHLDLLALLPINSEGSDSSKVGRGLQHLGLVLCFAPVVCAGLCWVVLSFGEWGHIPACTTPDHLLSTQCIAKGLKGTPEKALIGYFRVRINRRVYILLKLVCYIYSNSWSFLLLEASWKYNRPLCPWQIIISFPEVMSIDNHSNELSDTLN